MLLSSFIFNSPRLWKINRFSHWKGIFTNPRKNYSTQCLPATTAWGKMACWAWWDLDGRYCGPTFSPSPVPTDRNKMASPKKGHGFIIIQWDWTLRQLYCQLLPQCGRGAFQRNQSNRSIFRVKQTFQCSTAGLHAICHFSFWQFLVLHFFDDLISNHTFDGNSLYLLVNFFSSLRKLSKLLPMRFLFMA